MRSLLLAAAVAAAAVPLNAAPPSVVLRRGPDVSSEVRDWFAGLDRMLDRSQALTSSLVSHAAHPTAGAAKDAAVSLATIAGVYADISGDGEGAGGAKAASDRVLRLAAGEDGAPLDKQATDAVYSLEEGSLHRWNRLLRQAALRLSGPRTRIPANSLLTFREGDRKTELAFLDVSLKPLSEEGRILSPSLRAAVEAVRALRPGREPVEGEFVLGTHRIWMRRLGAELYADFSSRGGDMLRVRCRERKETVADQARFYFLTRVLFDLGYAVSVQNGELLAMVGGEDVPLSHEERIDLFANAWRALETSALLGPALKDYLRDSVSQADNAERLDRLAGVFAAEGGLPFFDPGDPAGLRKGLEAYLEKDPAREKMRAEMDSLLSRYGLGSFPAGRGVGQRTIDLYYNAPVEAALARRELRRTKKGVTRDGSYAPLERLARLAGGKKLPAGTAGRLGPVLERARTIGLVGPRVAQRAQLRAGPGEWAVAYVLRDPASGEPEFLDVQKAYSDRKPEDLGRKEALALLEALGLLDPESPSAERPGKSRPGDPESTFFGRVLSGTDGSPFTARITYDRAKAEMGDRIFVTPYLAPADHKAVRRCRALVTTAGGPQAAMLAALSGVPALNFAQASWSESSGVRFEQVAFSKPRRTRSGRRVRSAARWTQRILREGDAVRVAPALGTLELIGADRQAVLLRLEEALRAYDRGADIQAMALWAAGQLSAAGLTPGQKRDLADTLLDEMRRRVRGGAPKAHLERIRALVKKHIG